MAEIEIDSFDNTAIPDPGTYLIKYKVTDEHDNIVEKTRTVIIEDTTAPTVTLIGSASVSVDEDTSYSDQGVNWSDNDSQATLDTDDGGFDINTPGVYTYTYTATDRSGNLTSRTRAVTVLDKTPPVITLNGSATVTHEAGTTYTDAGATAFDAVDGEVTVAVTNPVNRNITGNYTVTYTATDAAGNSSTASRTVTVQDTIKPVITLNGSATVTHEAGTLYTDAGATATDTFDTNVQVTTSGSVDVNSTGSYTIRYNATDDAGNAADEVTRTVTVQDTIKPVITLNGSETVTHEAGTLYTDAGATATDTFDTNVQVTTSGSVNVNSTGSYTITYTATDDAGNSSTASRTVTVQDTIKPVITLNGSATVTHEAGTAYTDAGVTATDTFDTNVQVTTSGTVDVNTPGSYTITYTATDDAGNSSTASRTVTVQDTTAPDAPSGGDQNFFLYKGDDAPSAPSCSGSTLVTSGDILDMSTAGTYEITYTCQDDAGNESGSVAYSIVVSDPEDPEPVPIEDELLDLGDDEEATLQEYSTPLSGEFTQTVPDDLEISEDSLDILCSGDTAVFGGSGYYGASVSHPKEIPGLLVEQIWSTGAAEGFDRWFETTYAIPKNDGTGANLVVTNKATTLWTFNKVHNKNALTYKWTSGLGINPSGPLSTFEPMSGGGDKFYGMFGPHEFHNSETAGEVGWGRKLLKEDGTALASAYPISYTVLTDDNISEWETRVQQANISGKYTFYDSNNELDLRLERYINDPDNNLIQTGDIITLAWYPLIQSIDVSLFCDAEPADDVVPFYTNSTYDGKSTDGVVPNRIQTSTITATTNANNSATTLEVSNTINWQLVPQSCDATKIVYSAAGGATAEIKVHPTDNTKSQWTDTNNLSVTLDGGFFKYEFNQGSLTVQTSGPPFTWIQDDNKFVTGTSANQVVTYTAIRPYEGVTGSGHSWSNQTTLTTYGYRTPAQLGVEV